MKKAAFILKIVSTGLLFVCGLFIMLLGVQGKGGDAYIYTSAHASYEYYGGDAYTGIQHAAADTANNVASIGGFLSQAIDNIYLWGGVILMVISIYLFACALATVANDNKATIKKDLEENKALTEDAVS